MKQIVVIGAGASGLMAAISAARMGAAVTVLEQNEKPGKKLNATGNGRCNLTNLAQPADAWRGTYPEFVKDALREFSVEDTLRFFTELGLEPVSKNGYVYPRSMQASTVTEVLTAKAQSLGVKIKTREKVQALQEMPKGASSSLHRWTVHTGSWQYDCDAVILACGSKASNISGADGSGYALAKALGHPVVPPFPALCGLKLTGDRRIFSGWAGVRTEGSVTVTIYKLPSCPGRDTDLAGAQSSYPESDTDMAGARQSADPAYTERTHQTGELQLTDYGISGIPVFQVSRYAVQALRDGCRVSVSLDFLPEIPAERLEEFWEKRRRTLRCISQRERDLYRGLFPEKLAKLLAEQKNGAVLSKGWSFPVSGGMGFEAAQVCGGGVDIAQVDSRTMRSRLLDGISFTGELLDIDGTCGGYNLQWAWSSGYTAGKYAAVED